MQIADSDSNLRLQAAGVNFYAQQRGEEPRAVFLHGFAGDLHTWDLLWPELHANLPALRYDLRGFGRSLFEGDDPYSHADDLLAIVDKLGIAGVDLIGVSMGGSTALNFALDHPERVRRLVLISPGLVGWEWSESWLNLWRPIVAHARAGNMDEARRLWWQHPLFATTRSSAAAPALFDSIMRYTGAQWVRDSHRPMLSDIERLYSLHVPTLLMTGGCDVADFRLIAQLIEASVSDLVRVDNPLLGHLLHLENAAECASQILAFLAGARQQ